ncbi:MAG: hypothetical protein XD84_0394 [Desulfotomaculum sp. 46_80]|nr:MAG: hypothetical protein XD84_0394 [Desulfotomaculum sp. 46_80]HAU31276.1 hypothetical protein [Desulfotomaculum sp.]
MILVKILGLTSEELQTQLKAGKTLEQIANDKGMTLEQLKQKWLANVQAELDNQVSLINKIWFIPGAGNIKKILPAPFFSAYVQLLFGQIPVTIKG